jgi:hypothetical protein
MLSSSHLICWERISVEIATMEYLFTLTLFFGCIHGDQPPPTRVPTPPPLVAKQDQLPKPEVAQPGVGQTRRNEIVRQQPVNRQANSGPTNGAIDVAARIRAAEQQARFVNSHAQQLQRTAQQTAMQSAAASLRRSQAMLAQPRPVQLNGFSAMIGSGSFSGK